MSAPNLVTSVAAAIVDAGKDPYHQAIAAIDAAVEWAEQSDDVQYAPEPFPPGPDEPPDIIGTA